MKLFGLLTFAAWTVLLVPSFAQTASPGETLTTNPAYSKMCAKCHGNTADGRHFGGPSLKSEKVSNTTVDVLRDIITHGKGHMPKFSGKLNEQEIGTLVEQIKALNQK